MQAVEVTGKQYLKLSDQSIGVKSQMPDVHKGSSSASYVTSSLAAVHEHAVANTTRFGCRDLKVQCRDEARHVTIDRAKTLGQHAGAVAGGVGMMFAFAFELLTIAAVHEARQ